MFWPHKKETPKIKRCFFYPNYKHHPECYDLCLPFIIFYVANYAFIISVFDVEDIVNVNEKGEFRVLWTGYQGVETWEPYENISDALKGSMEWTYFKNKCNK